MRCSAAVAGSPRRLADLVHLRRRTATSRTAWSWHGLRSDPYCVRLLRAQRSIIVLAWDFNSQTRLHFEPVEAGVKRAAVHAEAVHLRFVRNRTAAGPLVRRVIVPIHAIGVGKQRLHRLDQA